MHYIVEELKRTIPEAIDYLDYYVTNVIDSDIKIKLKFSKTKAGKVIHLLDKLIAVKEHNYGSKLIEALSHLVDIGKISEITFNRINSWNKLGILKTSLIYHRRFLDKAAIQYNQSNYRTTQLVEMYEGLGADFDKQFLFATEANTLFADIKKEEFLLKLDRILRKCNKFHWSAREACYVYWENLIEELSTKKGLLNNFKFTIIDKNLYEDTSVPVLYVLVHEQDSNTYFTLEQLTYAKASEREITYYWEKGHAVIVHHKDTAVVRKDYLPDFFNFLTEYFY